MRLRLAQHLCLQAIFKICTVLCKGQTVRKELVTPIPRLLVEVRIHPTTHIVELVVNGYRAKVPGGLRDFVGPDYLAPLLVREGQSVEFQVGKGVGTFEIVNNDTGRVEVKANHPNGSHFAWAPPGNTYSYRWTPPSTGVARSTELQLMSEAHIHVFDTWSPLADLTVDLAEINVMDTYVIRKRFAANLEATTAACTAGVSVGGMDATDEKAAFTRQIFCPCWATRLKVKQDPKHEWMFRPEPKLPKSNGGHRQSSRVLYVECHGRDVERSDENHENYVIGAQMGTGKLDVDELMMIGGASPLVRALVALDKQARSRKGWRAQHASQFAAFRVYRDMRDRLGRTALHTAAMLDRDRATRALLALGGDPGSRDVFFDMCLQEMFCHMPNLAAKALDQYYEVDPLNRLAHYNLRALTCVRANIIADAGAKGKRKGERGLEGHVHEPHHEEDPTTAADGSDSRDAPNKATANRAEVLLHSRGGGADGDGTAGRQEPEAVQSGEASAPQVPGWLELIRARTGGARNQVRPMQGEPSSLATNAGGARFAGAVALHTGASGNDSGGSSAHVLMQPIVGSSWITETALEDAVSLTARQAQVLDHPVMLKLVQEKWDSFGWHQKVGEIFMFMIFLALWSLSPLMRKYFLDQELSDEYTAYHTAAAENVTNSSAVQYHDRCYKDNGHYFVEDIVDWTAFVCLCYYLHIELEEYMSMVQQNRAQDMRALAIIGWECDYLLLSTKDIDRRLASRQSALEEHHRLKKASLSMASFLNGWNFVDIASYIFLLSGFVLKLIHRHGYRCHMAELDTAYSVAWGTGLVLSWVRVLKYLRVFKMFGAFVLMLTEIGFQVFKFAILFLVLLIPTSIVFVMFSQKGVDSEGNAVRMKSFSTAIFDAYRMSLGEIGCVNPNPIANPNFL
jgi:hypothetical protein